MIYILTGAFIILDFITGVIKAFKKKEFTSTLMREGLFHKVGSIVVIVFAGLVDYAQGYMDLGISIPLTTTVCVYITLMEIGSIIENVCIINPSIIPSKLQAYFQKLKSEVKEADSVDELHSKEG